MFLNSQRKAKTQMGKVKKSLREELLEEMKLGFEEVTIGKNVIRVYELSAPEYSKLYEDPDNEKIVGKHIVDGKEEDKKEIDVSRFSASMLINCCRDENDQLVFTKDDIDAIKNCKKAVFLKLSNAAKKVNGFGGEEKNSEAIPESSTFGESQLG